MLSIYPQQSLQPSSSESGVQGDAQAPAPPPPNPLDTDEFPALPGSAPVAPQIKRQQSKQQQQQAQTAAPQQPQQQQEKRSIEIIKPQPEVQATTAATQPQQQQQQQQQQPTEPALTPEAVLQQQEQYAAMMQQQQQQRQMMEFGLRSYITNAKQKIPDEVPSGSIFAIQEVHEKPFTQKPCYTVEFKKNRSDYINSLSLTTLFYAFFAMPGDKMQYLAAQRLCALGWRFHTGFCTWVHPTKAIERDGQYIGTWEVFTCENWDVTTAEMVVFHKDLAPPVPELQQQQQQQQQ